jgi:hypothetical protein
VLLGLARLLGVVWALLPLVFWAISNVWLRPGNNQRLRDFAKGPASFPFFFGVLAVDIEKQAEWLQVISLATLASPALVLALLWFERRRAGDAALVVACAALCASLAAMWKPEPWVWLATFAFTVLCAVLFRTIGHRRARVGLSGQPNQAPLS